MSTLDDTPLTNLALNASGQIRVRLVQVLTQHQVMIQAYAYAIVRDHHLAEDVYQEVAAIVAGRADTVPEDDGVLPWLREITRRKALELRRRSRRIGILLSDEVIDALAPAFEQTASETGADLRQAMADCVDKLPPEARTVVEGRYGSDRSCEELAEEIGRSVQGVYGMLKRLRLALARCVQQNVGRRVEAL
jgi:RNA polymerase sigma-70 factor (ECF subfamily)